MTIFRIYAVYADQNHCFILTVFCLFSGPPGNARTKVTWVPLSAWGGWTGSDRNATNSPDNGIVNTWLILNTPVSLLPIYPFCTIARLDHVFPLLNAAIPPPVADLGISEGGWARVLHILQLKCMRCMQKINSNGSWVHLSWIHPCPPPLPKKSYTIDKYIRVYMCSAKCIFIPIHMQPVVFKSMTFGNCFISLNKHGKFISLMFNLTILPGSKGI